MTRTLLGTNTIRAGDAWWLFCVSAALGMCLTIPWAATQISWTDSGELLASAVVLGIPHPTGYPLLSLISRAVLSLLPWADPITSLHTVSAVCVGLAVGCVSVLSYWLLHVSSSGREATRGIMVAALASGIFFATSLTVWRSAVSYEVYGFQSMLYGAALCVFMISLRDQEKTDRTMSRWWLMFGIVLGFGFAHHMTTVFLLPACAWLLWRQLRPLPGKLILLIGVGMIFAMSTYAALYVRAAAEPPLNWGDVSSLRALLAHMTGAQYRVWMFEGADAFIRSATEFVSAFPSEIGWTVLLLATVGAVRAWRRTRDLFWFSLLLMSTAMIYSFNYDIHDIETYYILVHMVTAILAGSGVASVADFVAARRGRKELVGAGVLVFAAGFAIVPRIDDYRSPDVNSPEPFARAVLTGVPEGSTIVTGRWDYIYSPILALQHVKKVRTDVRMIDIHLLRDRSWYVKEILLRDCADEQAALSAGEAFLVELRKFERGEPVSVGVLQLRWNDFLQALISALQVGGPFLADHEVVRELPRWLDYQPDGYLLRAIDPSAPPPYTGLPDYLGIQAENAELSHDYRLFCSTVFLNHGLYARSIGDSSLVVRSLDQAVRIESSNPLLSALRQ